MQNDRVLPVQDAEQTAEQAAAEAAAALLLEEEELAAYAAAKEAKKQKAKAKKNQAQQPQSSSKSAQIDDPGNEQPPQADSADIQSKAGSQSVQTASPGQTSAYAETSDLMLSPPQSINADSRLDMYDASAAVSTQEDGEQWVQAAATSKKGRAHKAKAMQQQAGLHWQHWSKASVGLTAADTASIRVTGRLDVADTWPCTNTAAKPCTIFIPCTVSVGFRAGITAAATSATTVSDCEETKAVSAVSRQFRQNSSSTWGLAGL